MNKEQKEIDKIRLKTPCVECPFLKEKGISHLGANIAKKVLLDNKKIGFVCHKTAMGDIENRKQCAGAMIYARKSGTPQPWLEKYEELFGEMELNNQDSIVTNQEEFIKKHSL